jgi:hypothetical protein
MRISKRFYRCPHNKPKVDVLRQVAWSELPGADHPVSLYFKADDGSRILVEMKLEEAAALGTSLTSAAESIARAEIDAWELPTHYK